MSENSKPTYKRWYRDQDIEEFPDPDYLIENYIESKAFTVIYGPPGGGKTFVVLDMGLSVATGRDWHGHSVQQGGFAYVTGEGTAGLKKRIAAWRREHGLPPIEDAIFTFEPVQLINDFSVEQFIASVAGTKLKLIVIDTLATSMVGADENSTQDMGKAIAGIRRIQKRTEAAVVVVHHSAKAAKIGKPKERGSSALRGAADAMIRIDHTGDGALVITNDKRKDDEEAAPLFGHLKVIDLGRNDRNRSQSSCVFEPSDDEFVSTDREEGLDNGQLEALTALAVLPNAEATTKAWFQSFRSRTRQSSETLNRRRRELLADGYIELVSVGRYRLSAKGSQAVTTLSLPVIDAATQSLSHPVGVTEMVDVSGGLKRVA